MTDYYMAAERLRLALPMMAQKKVSATPINYAVFYEYVSKTNELLNDEVDRLMAQHGAISDDVCKEVYDKKLMAFELESLQKMQQGLRSIVDALLVTLKDSDDEAARYVGVLDGISQGLTQDIEPNKLMDMVDLLSQETQSMRNTQAHMKKNIEGNQHEVTRLKKELEQAKIEATTDALTGLMNRKAIDESLYEEVARDPKSRKTDLCVLVIDIDKFKRINDKHGHLVGDKVIRYVANMIKTNVNLEAKVARFGGEEFVVLLPDANLTTAVNVAENIRKAQEKGKLVTNGANEAIGKVTVSVGVTNYSVGESVDAFIDRADKALYQAKTKGRNCVVHTPCNMTVVKSA